MLPEAVAEFTRHWMNADWLRSEDSLHSIRERMLALKRDSQRQPPLARRKFVEFPSSGIYPPGLYLPQSLGIRISRLLSDRVYVWFYSARVCNALCAVLLIFLALRLAPGYELLLLLPAVLPMSLSQMATVSSDASIFGLTTLFIALCIRFLNKDNFLIRSGLVLSLLLLVMGKPVHLALGLLLLLAHKRLGWRRAISFCLLAVGVAIIFYAGWSFVIKRFFSLAGEAHGQNPAAQIHFITLHPISFLRVLLVTLRHGAVFLSREMIGVLGWEVLVFPAWFYLAVACLLAIILFIVFFNCKKVGVFNLAVGSLAASGLVMGVLLAAYILWTPPRFHFIIRLQGRYFIPALAILATLSPPFSRLSWPSRVTLAISTIGCLLLSAYFTVRMLDHYYFPRSIFLEKNIHDVFKIVPDQSCSASEENVLDSWLDWVITGTSTTPGEFRVLATTEDGTIVGESDPALAGADFPYVLLPGSSRSRWRLHVWLLNRNASLRFWLVRGNSACSFGSELHFKPIAMPDA
jgi:uncharacterized membrane protein